MNKNIQSFIELCNGEFGRKVAYTYVDEITRENRFYKRRYRF